MKHIKKILALLCCLCLTLGTVAMTGGLRLSDGTVNTASLSGSAVEESASGGDGDDSFNNKLSSMIHRYDTQETAKDTSLPENRFALRRLLVIGFDGNTYGAAEYAYDEENDFCVLQYETEAETEAAYNEMQAAGVDVDPDSYLEMDEDTTPHQQFTYDSKTGAGVGLPTFLKNFQMEAEEVVIALIDTGVMYDCPGLEDRFASHGKDLSGDEAEDAYFDASCAEKTPDGKDYLYYHATFISGIIADNTGNNVKILPYKTVRFGHTGPNAAAVAASVNDAVKSGADVVNISMHSNSNINAINSAIKNAAGKGVCVCVSAGNEAKECYAYPQCSPEAITVAALDPIKDYEHMVYSYAPMEDVSIASYSNYGSVVDFAAPGMMRSVVPTTDGIKITTKQGTSFSSPIVACLCAEIKSMNKNLSKKEVYDLLVEFCVDKGDAGWDEHYGHGVPVLSDMTFSDEENTYEYKLPQGTLAVHKAADYTAETQPWRLFADKLMSVTVDSDIDRIGDYTLYNVSKAAISCPQELGSVGDYAFYNCDTLSSYTFDINVEKVGYKAFGDIENFEITGYRNTPAESYALSDGITFHALGCRHNYIYDVVEPTDTEEGYTVYTCTVCGDSYIGAYIEPALLESGACGENLTYALYDNGKLVIDGTGGMYDYFEQEAPWYAKRQQVRVLQIEKDVTGVDAFAFYGCSELVKIRCDAANTALYADSGLSLLTKADGALVLTAAKNEYTLPEAVKTINAQAFICTGDIAVVPNSRFTVENGIVYDAAGNIAVVLPEFAQSTLKIENDINIAENAFMLTQFPKTLEINSLTAQLGPHAVGYYYNGTMKKLSLVMLGSSDSAAYTYARENGFTFKGVDVGDCGENITWRYENSTATLTLSGTGDMYDYYALSSIPWRQFLSKIKTVKIADGISSVSMYAFYNATALRTLTLPLSLAAPEDESTWYNCTGITKVTFTYGTGYMDDYVLDDGNGLYKFTPWYLSRNKITSLTLDANVKYVGQQAFRGCSAMKEVTLNSVETIADNAFLADSALTKITILNKDADIADYSLAHYYYNGYSAYSSPKIYAYADSTAHDYAKKFLKESQFVSLGCAHSRHLTPLQEQTDAYGRLYGTYRCEDCGEEFSVSSAHTVTLNVMTTTGEIIPDAVLTVGTREGLVTDDDGTVMLGLQSGGVYTVSVTCHDTLLFEGEMYIDGETVQASIVLRYGDFVDDGAINAKDYAYVLRQGFDEAKLFEYGTLNDGDSYITVLNGNRVIQ